MTVRRWNSRRKHHKNHSQTTLSSQGIVFALVGLSLNRSFDLLCDNGKSHQILRAKKRVSSDPARSGSSRSFVVMCYRPSCRYASPRTSWSSLHIRLPKRTLLKQRLGQYVLVNIRISRSLRRRPIQVFLAVRLASATLFQ
jgi:hypothetical protein